MTTSNTFLPDSYVVPKGESNYMKFEKGANKFRVISSATIGYEYWNTENKPQRSPDPYQTTPTDIRVESDGKVSEIKHFWAFAVIDRSDSKVKILEITQKSIMREIQDLVSNDDWGLPQGYDITVTREGDGFDTRYTVQPSPHKELTEQDKKLAATPVNVPALFSGGDPFEEKIEIAPVEEKVDVLKDMGITDDEFDINDVIKEL